ncbi:hypothetical protein CEP51_001648 [Fusarium floridanum]|uniref:Uncharacterized protein n=1 Tax=Fusarium floridanum TaxID=1325733 RepID=A0A428SFF5_9HYPO|nr:hypothetical protein CEP51_001648 [Fusarium floridanum]
MDSQNTPRSIIVVETGGTIAARGASQKYESGVKLIIDYSIGDSIDKTDRDHIELTAYIQEHRPMPA